MKDRSWQAVLVWMDTRRGWVPLRGIYSDLACTTCGAKDRVMYRLTANGPTYCVGHAREERDRT